MSSAPQTETDPQPRPRKTVNCGLVGVPEYRDWLHRFAESEHQSGSDLVEAALRAYARSKRFEAPPRRAPLRFNRGA